MPLLRPALAGIACGLLLTLLLAPRPAPFTLYGEPIPSRDLARLRARYHRDFPHSRDPSQFREYVAQWVTGD